MSEYKLKDRLMIYFPYAHLNYQISSRSNIYNVVSKDAYNDMTPRNLKGIGNYPKEKEIIFNYVTDEIEKYFSDAVKTKEEFDIWHRSFCEEICNKFISLTGIELKFGKAQKLVNITFKHLYCFADSDNKSEYFKYCHIPIDNNIINWSKKNANIKKPRCAWSNLDYDEYKKFENDVYSWLHSEDNKEYFDENNNPISSLQLDFWAWSSDENAQKGIVDFWKKVQEYNKIWIDKKELIKSIFPEI